jgi:hypothetical protein
MNSTELRQAYREFLAVAADGEFGPPPPGEWDAARLLAHVASVDAGIAAVALAVVAGHRPGYDNRVNLDEWNLRRIADQAGDLPGLVDLVRRTGDLLCGVAELMTEADLEVQVPILIVSNDEVVVDEPGPVRFLVEGVGRIHLPRHAEQLRSLQLAPAGTG